MSEPVVRVAAHPFGPTRFAPVEDTPQRPQPNGSFAVGQCCSGCSNPNCPDCGEGVARGDERYDRPAVPPVPEAPDQQPEKIMEATDVKYSVESDLNAYLLAEANGVIRDLKERLDQSESDIAWLTGCVMEMARTDQLVAAATAFVDSFERNASDIVSATSCLVAVAGGGCCPECGFARSLCCCGDDMDADIAEAGAWADHVPEGTDG
jgi:hypothetical protein